MRTDEGTGYRSAIPFVVADGVALITFVLVGIRSHHEIGALAVFLRNAVPLEVMWFAVAAVTGAYRRPGIRTLLWTWLVAVPVALIVRTLWVGSPGGLRLLTFLGIGLTFTLLFLLIGRAVAGFAGRWIHERRTPERGSMVP